MAKESSNAKFIMVVATAVVSVFSALVIGGGGVIFSGVTERLDKLEAQAQAHAVTPHADPVSDSTHSIQISALMTDKTHVARRLAAIEANQKNIEDKVDQLLLAKRIGE